MIAIDKKIISLLKDAGIVSESSLSDELNISKHDIRNRIMILVMKGAVIHTEIDGKYFYRLKKRSFK